MIILASLLTALPAPAAGMEAAPFLPFCTMISAAEGRARRDQPARLVTVTADLGWEMHGGMYLSFYPTCPGSVGNTGTTGLTEPEGERIAGLERFFDPDFRRSSLGKHIYCTCVGEISYPQGFPQFVLRRVVRIWTAPGPTPGRR